MRTIELVDYDPLWATLFEERRARIAGLLDHPAEIHHIGSTAVPGLCAKPKLDIDAVMESQTAIVDATGRLEDDGYAFHGNLGDAGRWAFTKDETPYGTRLYLCLTGNPAHADRILFRDYLRRHPEAAAAYALLKQRLATESKGDWDHYTGAKTDFVADILDKARMENSDITNR
ncbi:MAG: GrpB family protein [Rhizobiaceae bacterium]|nr:GrpB family protein [Rhizobiaceae bacterium]